MTSVRSTLVRAVLALWPALPAGAIDLTGTWRIEHTPTWIELADVAQTGASVTMTIPGSGGPPLVLSGTFDEPNLTLSLQVPGCVPPTCYGGTFAHVLPGGHWFDGRLVFGAPPLPGVTRLLASRCECDDGNTAAGDGCDANCRVEPCFACAGVPSACTPLPDGDACDDRRDCTAGTTCSAGACGGGAPVSGCLDMTGLWDQRSDGGGFTFDSSVSYAQRDGVLLSRDPTSGVAGALGTIDSRTGTFTTETPSLNILCAGFDQGSGSLTADGAAFSATGTSSIATPRGCFTVDFTTTGTRRLCGDGTLDAGEPCDDGNAISGDGCDATCRPTGCGSGVVTAGEGCDDGNGIGGDGCDAACAVEPCWTCTGAQPSICSTTYRPFCARPRDPRRASLVLRRPADPPRAAIAVRSGPTGALTAAAVGDPRASASYLVCLFDRSAPSARLLFGARVPAGGECGGEPCWRAVPGGFAYRNRDAEPHGIGTLLVIGDDRGGGRVLAAGRGARLAAAPAGLPVLPLPVPVELQVQNASDGAGCIAVEIPAAGVIRNDAAAGRFAGRGAP